MAIILIVSNCAVAAAGWKIRNVFPESPASALGDLSNITQCSFGGQQVFSIFEFRVLLSQRLFQHAVSLLGSFELLALPAVCLEQLVHWDTVRIRDCGQDCRDRIDWRAHCHAYQQQRQREYLRRHRFRSCIHTARLRHQQSASQLRQRRTAAIQRHCHHRARPSSGSEKGSGAQRPATLPVATHLSSPEN